MACAARVKSLPERNSDENCGLMKMVSARAFFFFLRLAREIYYLGPASGGPPAIVDRVNFLNVSLPFDWE